VGSAGATANSTSPSNEVPEGVTRRCSAAPAARASCASVTRSSGQRTATTHSVVLVIGAGALAAAKSDAPDARRDSVRAVSRNAPSGPRAPASTRPPASRTSPKAFTTASAAHASPPPPSVAAPKPPFMAPAAPSSLPTVAPVPAPTLPCSATSGDARSHAS
jgi:hypothetical protein